MKFADFLRLQREQLGWTQPEAASAAGIDQSYLSKLETGKSLPSQEVFDQLIAAYELTADAVMDAVDDAELDALRDVTTVRRGVAARARGAVRAARAWMLAGLVCLFIGGGSAGVFVLAEDAESEQYRYVSPGVIAPGEDLGVYAILERRLPERAEDERAEVTAMRARQVEMLARADEVFVSVEESRGDGFIETVEGGRRFYQNIGAELVITPSPLRWFMVPAIMFLVGGIGCFVVSLRWRA